MNGLEGEVTRLLPEWATWIAIAAVALLILWRYRRGNASKQKRDSTASPLTLLHEQESPGRTGNGATRDLTASEILALRTEYAPALDGEPDPGEVIWTWVPFVEYDGRGKDRPVLIIARIDDGAWAGCYLSTKQHRGFVSIGSGAWDSQRRESFLSPERVLRVTEQGMRRESTGIDRAKFERAVAAVKKHHSG